MAVSTGTRLGPYEILEPLGSGGMGEVYRARDSRLGRAVAVKVVRTGDETSADRVRRFEDEARAVASLSHPNVLTVFDVGTHDGTPYVVFELLEGETLRSLVERGPRGPICLPSGRCSTRWCRDGGRFREKHQPTRSRRSCTTTPLRWSRPRGRCRGWWTGS